MTEKNIILLPLISNNLWQKKIILLSMINISADREIPRNKQLQSFPPMLPISTIRYQGNNSI